jgi:hypothetical protein
LLQLTVERLPVDTSAQRAFPTGVRPETRTRGPTRRTILEGLGLGVLVLAVPAAVNDGGLSGHALPPPAWAVAGSVAIASIVLRHSEAPISENVRYNELMRTQWQAQNRAIAARNASKRRWAPVRIRAAREP